MTITKKQICLMLITLVPASKFLVLPSVYSAFAKNDAWFAGLLNCILDGVLLAVILLFLRKFNGQTLYSVIEYNLGKVGAKIVFFIYFIYFMLKTVIPVFEQKNFTEITLYETSPTVLTFLPFFLVSFYMCVKGLKTMARTGEITFWFTIFGLSLVLFLSIGTTEFYYLQPVLKNPLKQTLTATYSALIWYGQPIILLFLSGKIKREKKFELSVVISFVFIALVCVLMFAVFTGIYGDIAVRQIYALTKMTKYAIALSNVGRFDYIATLFLVATGVLSLSVPLIFATECLTCVFGSKRRWLLALIVNALMLGVISGFDLYFQNIINFFEKYFTPVMFTLVYAVTPLMLLFRRIPENALLKK